MADSKQYITQEQENGTVMISEEVTVNFPTVRLRTRWTALELTTTKRRKILTTLRFGRARNRVKSLGILLGVRVDRGGI